MVRKKKIKRVMLNEKLLTIVTYSTPTPYRVQRTGTSTGTQGTESRTHSCSAFSEETGFPGYFYASGMAEQRIYRSVFDVLMC